MRDAQKWQIFSPIIRMPAHLLRGVQGTLQGLTLSVNNAILAWEHLSDTIEFLRCMFSNLEAMHMLDLARLAGLTLEKPTCYSSIDLV
jgi:hypothetical protein